jgi:Ankyrin repeats (3 copies)/Ankyrin repeat
MRGASAVFRRTWLVILALISGCATTMQTATSAVPGAPTPAQVVQACMTVEVPAMLARLGIDSRIRTREDAGMMAHYICQHSARSCQEAPAADACLQALSKYGLGGAQPVLQAGGLLFDAAYRGDTPGVSRLLAEGGEVNWRNIGGWTPVMIAAAERHADTVAVLLAAKADPNLRNHYGRTALMFAAGYGELRIVEQLLAAGADPNLVPSDQSGWTALMAAAARGQAPVVAMLLRAKADTSLRARDGRTALELARAGGHVDTARLLEAAGISGT